LEFGVQAIKKKKQNQTKIPADFTLGRISPKSRILIAGVYRRRHSKFNSACATGNTVHFMLYN